MPTVNSSYKNELRTEAVHLQSGNRIITDAPVDNQGKGEAFSPTDLVSSALSSCMMTIMGIYARDEGIDLNGLSAEVNKIMQEEPRKIAEVQIAFTWPNPVATPEQMETLKDKAIHCPVALSLDPAIKQTVSFNF